MPETWHKRVRARHDDERKPDQGLCRIRSATRAVRRAVSGLAAFHVEIELGMEMPQAQFLLGPQRPFEAARSDALLDDRQELGILVEHQPEIGLGADQRRDLARTGS